MNLVPFTYADQPVRVVELDGEPWFVASDITPILGYQHGPSAIRRLDADEHRSVPFALVDSTVRPGLVFGPRAAPRLALHARHTTSTSASRTASPLALRSHASGRWSAVKSSVAPQSVHQDWRARARRLSLSHAAS